jgi:predicted transcriptional regulator
MENRTLPENEQLVTRTVLVQTTGQIVAGFLAGNTVPAHEVPDVIQSIYRAVSDLTSITKADEVSAQPPLLPAVDPKESVFPDYIICLEDGQRYTMLRRTLKLKNLTPDQYRLKWGLPPDYPMVAPNYSARRSDLAKKMGLGLSQAAKAQLIKKTTTTKARRGAKAPPVSGASTRKTRNGAHAAAAQ